MDKFQTTVSGYKLPNFSYLGTTRLQPGDIYHGAAWLRVRVSPLKIEESLFLSAVFSNTAPVAVKISKVEDLASYLHCPHRRGIKSQSDQRFLKMKCIGMYTGQAEDEKSQTKNEKVR